MAIAPTSTITSGSAAKKREPETTSSHTIAKSPTKSVIHRFKCVSFDLQPSFHAILSRHDFSAEEIDNAWYCHLEMEAMVAAAMDPGEADQDDGNAGSLRGLEKYTSTGSTRLEIHRVAVVAAVLREQQRQRLFTTCLGKPSNGDELVAAASANLSRECQNLAYIQGYNDEVEAYAGDSAARTDVVAIPKPGLFSGFAKQVRALSDLAFLETQRK